MPYEFNESEWLTTTQAAEVIGVSAATIRSWRSEGRRKELRYVRLGNVCMYPKETVERFAEEYSAGRVTL